MAEVESRVNTFIRDTLINGEPSRIECLEVFGQTYAISQGAVTTVHLEDEWFDDVRAPRPVIATLKEGPVHADIFTFWQRLPNTEPLFEFYHEWDSIAALPVTTLDHWWNKQIRPVTRNLIRKAQKKGVEVRETTFDDDFVRGMTDIFNEAPVRQGRRFWHYGKDFETVKQQFSRYLFREHLLGAYHEDELIGFIMLADAGTYGSLGQIISKLRHRDKSPTNALVAKAVEVCAQKHLPYLVYAHWGDGPLVDFKRHNGFAETRLPRYYVPLTRKGQLAIALGVHGGWKQLIPIQLRAQLKRLRSRWLSVTTTAGQTSCPE